MSPRGVIPLLLALAGCQAPTYYAWGHYEDSVLLVTTEPDGFELDQEIDTLVTQLATTANEDRRVPPGLHAHLGWLLFLRGDAREAGSHFRLEKELYSESAVFMDGLLLRLEGPVMQP